MKRAVFLSRLPPIPGAASAEAIGDYGAGPNHVLPTSQTARHTAGLSVFNFLRARTWIQIQNGKRARILYSDASGLATLEGLQAHARASMLREST
ncbi:MAG: histidinol dehydrogenase [Sphingomonadales bacterium]